jgi:hypothetical protein
MKNKKQQLTIASEDVLALRRAVSGWTKFTNSASDYITFS